MKYQIIATLNGSPKDVQAMTALIMERCETLEFKQLPSGDGRSPGGQGTKKIVQYGPNAMVKAGTGDGLGLTEQRAQVLMAIKKKWGDKPLQKRALYHYLKKDLKVPSGGSSAVHWLLNHKFLVLVDGA